MLYYNHNDIMTQSTFSIRMDESLKNEFSEMCDAFGISMAAAINMFAKAVVRERRIPFEITADDDQRRRTMDSFLKIRGMMKERFPIEPTLEEINAEIDSVRESRS